MSNYEWGPGSSRSRKSDAAAADDCADARKGFFSGSAPRPNDDQAKPDVSLRQMLEQIMRLPALPQTAAAVIQVADSADSSARDLKEVVSTDQALVARLLRVVNSPMYALRQRVSTVTHAIALLGFDAVKNLALAASFAEVLTAPAEGYGLDPGRLWAHSIAVGCASRAVAEVAGHENPEEAFVAGVIHDLGKLAIHSYVKEKYDLIVRAVRLGGRAFDAVEEQTLGFSHAQAGHAVAEKWGLPDVLSEPIMWHHRPEDAEDTMLASIVHIGDVIGISLGYGLGRDGLAYVFRGSAVRITNISDRQIQKIAAELPESVARLTQIAQGNGGG